MSGLVKFAAIALGAAFCGIYSAQALQDGRYGWFKDDIGTWETWPSAGTNNADPYTRAHFVAVQQLPISRFETLEFETSKTKFGNAIEANCTYTISGRLPAMRRWSLSAYSVDNDEVGSATGNNSLSSDHAIHLSNGQFAVTLSATPASGNWLQPNGDGEQRLLLRYFGSTRRVSGKILADDLPDIERKGCQ